MKLDDNFTLETDTTCTTLYYKRKYKAIDKDGKEIEKTSSNTTYHANITQGLSAYVNDALSVGIKPNTKVEELLEKQKEVLEIIKQLQ